jgi:hypothetical protein
LVFEQELGLFGNLVVRCSSFSCLDIPCFSLLYWCIIRCLRTGCEAKASKVIDIHEGLNHELFPP